MQCESCGAAMQKNGVLGTYVCTSDQCIRALIERARKAQQQHPQVHPVQLEMEVK